MTSNARSAFTLVEVLVVIAITALLAGLILSYSSSSRDQVALYVQQAKLSQTIAKAKSLTISTYNQPTTPCGYGVHMDYVDSTYTLFSYDPPEGPMRCANLDPLNSDFQTEVITERLPGNLAIKPSGASGPDATSIVDILFLPPNPDTWIWLHGGFGTSTSGRVPLSSRSGSFSVSVSVSSAGQISF